MTGPRALVVHTGGIGDFLLTCPAVRRLAQDGPLELLGRTDRLELAVAAGIAAAAHDTDSADFGSVFTTPSERLRDFLARFDRCVVWMRDDGGIVRAIRQCGVAEVRAFPGLPPEDWTEHASRYHLNCLGYEDAGPLRLCIEPAETRHDLIIHPGSGGGRKNWPLDRFIAVAEAVRRPGRAVTWCLGPAEEGIQLPAQSEVLQTASLVGLARHLAAARSYLGNDSGITHLAAAVGCSTVAVFGPTCPCVWAPLGDHVTVVRGTPWPEVPTVLAQLICD